MNPRVNGVQVVEHLHLQGIVAHGDEAVLGLDEVEADEARFVSLLACRIHARLDGLKAQQRLREDLPRRKAAQNLVDVADLDPAGGHGLGTAAALDLAALGLGGAHQFAIGGDFLAQAEGEQFLAVPGKLLAGGVLTQGVFLGKPGGVCEGRRLHQLDILLIFSGGAAGHLVHPLAGVPIAKPAKAIESGEELVVAAEARDGDKTAHREGVNQPVVEQLRGRRQIAGQLCGRHERRRAGGLGKAQGRRIHAQAVLARLADEAFGVNRAGEVNVQVGALGELVQKGAQGRRSGVHGSLVGVGGAGFVGGGLGAHRDLKAGGRGGQSKTDEKASGTAHDAIQSRAGQRSCGGLRDRAHLIRLVSLETSPEAHTICSSVLRAWFGVGTEELVYCFQ